MTVHTIDVTVKRLRDAANEFPPNTPARVAKQDLIAVCDEIEKLERDVELAKQDWRA